MKNCPHCATPLPDEDAFCRKCGTRQDGSSAAQSGGVNAQVDTLTVGGDVAGRDMIKVQIGQPATPALDDATALNRYLTLPEPQDRSALHRSEMGGGDRSGDERGRRRPLGDLRQHGQHRRIRRRLRSPRRAEVHRADSAGPSRRGQIGRRDCLRRASDSDSRLV